MVQKKYFGILWDQKNQQRAPKIFIPDQKIWMSSNAWESCSFCPVGCLNKLLNMSASHEKRPTEEEQKRQHERQHPISSGQQGHGPNFCLILNPVFFSGLMALEKVGLWVLAFSHCNFVLTLTTSSMISSQSDRTLQINMHSSRKTTRKPAPRKPPPSVPRRHTIWLSSRKPWCWDAVVSSLAIRSNRVQSREVPERHTPALPSRSWSLVHSELEKLLRPKKESKYKLPVWKTPFFL